MARLIIPLRAVPAFSSSVLTQVPPIDWALLTREYKEAFAIGPGPPQAGGKNNIASARHLLLTLQTACNRERSGQQGSEAWALRARAVENLLRVTLALSKATTSGLL